MPQTNNNKVYEYLKWWTAFTKFFRLDYYQKTYIFPN